MHGNNWKQATGNSRIQMQQPLPIITEIRVGGILLVDDRDVEICHSLQEAIWLSMVERLTGRADRNHSDYAAALGMSRGNFSKKINGGNVPHGFLIALAKETGNSDAWYPESNSPFGDQSRR